MPFITHNKGRHSDEVEEIMGRRPPKILFYSNLIIAISTISLLSTSMFIKYPDTVSIQIVFFSSQSPDGVYSFESNVSFEKFEKLKAGQRVIIKLNEYAYQDYGLLKGEIRSIEKSPNDSMASFQIFLEKGLNTTYNKPIDSKRKLFGTADITISNQSFFQRIHSKITAVRKSG